MAGTKIEGDNKWLTIIQNARNEPRVYREKKINGCAIKLTEPKKLKSVQEMKDFDKKTEESLNELVGGLDVLNKYFSN